MTKQMSLIKNIDIGYFALKSKESLVITRKFRCLPRAFREGEVL